MNRYILKTDQYSFGWSDNTYKKVENQKALIIYHDGKLYFRSYSIAQPILDFSLLFTEQLIRISIMFLVSLYSMVPIANG